MGCAVDINSYIAHAHIAYDMCIYRGFHCLQINQPSNSVYTVFSV